MIADTIFTLLIWTIQHSILAILPTEFAFMPLLTFKNALEGMSNFFTSSFAGLNNIFPSYFFIGIIILIISAEVILFAIKGTMYIINLIRGSGA